MQDFCIPHTTLLLGARHHSYGQYPPVSPACFGKRKITWSTHMALNTLDICTTCSSVVVLKFMPQLRLTSDRGEAGFCYSSTPAGGKDATGTRCPNLHPPTALHGQIWGKGEEIRVQNTQKNLPNNLVRLGREEHTNLFL